MVTDAQRREDLQPREQSIGDIALAIDHADTRAVMPSIASTTPGGSLETQSA